MTRPSAHEVITHDIGPREITFGILAGGRATRLGGIDKAWLQRDGISQVERWQRRFEGQVAALLVSANHQLDRYAAIGLHAIPDRCGSQMNPSNSPRSLGPIAGLEALAHACRTPWLLTLPVDLMEFDVSWLDQFWRAAAGQGAYAVDEDGLQPLVALWSAADLRLVSSEAIAKGRLSVQSLQQTMGLHPLRLPGIRLGNLNTPQDLADAGVDTGHCMP